MKKNMMFLALFNVLLTACATNSTEWSLSQKRADTAGDRTEVRVWIAPKYAEALEFEDRESAKYKYISVRKKPVSLDQNPPRGTVQ